MIWQGILGGMVWVHSEGTLLDRSLGIHHFDWIISPVISLGNTAQSKVLNFIHIIPSAGEASINSTVEQKSFLPWLAGCRLTFAVVKITSQSKSGAYISTI
jgi:hypothetical protein